MNVVGILPIIPLAFAFALPLISIGIKGNRKFVEGYGIVGTGLTMVFAGILLDQVYSSSQPLVYAFGRWLAPVGIVYEVDRMSALIAFVTASLMFFIAIYNYKYLERHHGLEWYYVLYFGLEAGLLGVLLTGDAFNLFVMIEVTSVAAYALVMFYRDRGDSVLAGVKYAFIGAVGTTVYFIALGVMYGGIGTLNMADLAAKVHGIYFPITKGPICNVALTSAILLSLATWAFLIKAAIFPNHFWLPEAHPAAPSPISAILSGLVVNVGAYSMLRFFATIYADPLSNSLIHVIRILGELLVVLGAISAIFGAVMMNFQRDIKRLIAYSTIMHMGYIFSAIGIGTSLGVQAAIFHIINHSVAKALLFLAAGLFIYVAGTRNIEDLSGIGKISPVATFSLSIATFALVGVPPFNVFYSKLVLFTAFMQYNFFLALVIVISSVIALIAYMKLLYVMWLGKPKREFKGKIPVSMNGVCLFLALVTLAMGIAAPYIFQHFIVPAGAQAINYHQYIDAVKHLAEQMFNSLSH